VNCGLFSVHVLIEGAQHLLMSQTRVLCVENHLDRWEEHTDTLTKLLENYLSEEHRDAAGTGCALGALLGDMPRASRSAKAVYTARYKRTLAYSTGLVPPNGTSDRRARAILMISAMLGAINLSRAVSDPNLSREILRRTRDQLVSLNKPAKPH
jgi:TetR/AcrR family transcriptional repressor of nem operon